MIAVSLDPSFVVSTLDVLAGDDLVTVVAGWSGRTDLAVAGVLGVMAAKGVPRAVLTGLRRL